MRDPADNSQRLTRAVVFCDVTGSTSLRESMGDTEADAWFAGLAEHLLAAVTRAGGVLVKWLGDGLMAVFDSAGGALDAAVAMQQGADEHHRHSGRDSGARLRVGIAMGDLSSTDGDWFGMPVVIAARLCAAAEPETILASDVVAILAGSRCEHLLTAAGDFVLKGITAPVAAISVGWAPAPMSAPAEMSPILAAARRGPFVGRTGVLDDLLASWRTGAWRALFVGGEPGIGKTRLVAELTTRQNAAGSSVVIGRCNEEIAVSYRPWAEAMLPLATALSDEALAELAVDHIAELRRFAPGLAPRVVVDQVNVLGDADARHMLLGDAIVALLAVCGPVTLVFDDIHWIDHRSIQLIRQVLAAPLPQLSLVATFRDTELDASPALAAALADLQRVEGVRRLALRGIDHAAVEELVEHSTGRPLDKRDADFAHVVHNRTAGNPLFVDQLLRDLSDNTVPSADSLPEGLREVIGRRVERLGSGAIGVLRIGAALGHVFDVDVLERVVRGAEGDPDLDILDVLEAAEAAGVVVESGEHFEFRHAVIRDVLLAEMSARRRRRLHGQLASALEEHWAGAIDDHVYEIMHHHVEAGSPTAAQWCLRASNTAIAGLDTDAVTYASRGLDLLDGSATDRVLHCDLLISRALGVRLTGAETLPDVRLAYEAALEVGDEERIANALLALNVRSATDDHSEHVSLLSSGLERLTDTSLIARWEVETALVVRSYMGYESDPVDQIAQVDRIVAHLDPTDAHACQIAMRCARSLTSTNQPRTARNIADRFLANSAGVDTEGLPVDTGLAVMWLHLGDRPASDHYLSAALVNPHRRFWFFDCQVLQQVALRHMLDGAWEAADIATAAVERIGRFDPNFSLSSAAQRRWLQRETGLTSQSYATLREFEVGFPDFPILRALLASDAAEAGFAGEAMSRLDDLAADDFAAAGRGWLTLMALTELTWAAVTVNAVQHAPALRRLLQPYGGQLAVMATGTHVVGAVDRFSAGLAALEGRYEESDALYAQALEQERGVRSRPLEARTLQWWGRSLLSRGEERRGRDHLDRALALARDLDMRRVVQQITQL